MKIRTVFLSVGALLLVLVGVARYLEYSTERGLTTEQRRQIEVLVAELSQARPGDFISLGVPLSSIDTNDNRVRPAIAGAETYLVKSMRPGSLWLSGPGPSSQSYSEPSRILSWYGTGQLLALVHSKISVHRKEEPGWVELSNWYYVQ